MVAFSLWSWLTTAVLYKLSHFMVNVWICCLFQPRKLSPFSGCPTVGSKMFKDWIYKNGYWSDLWNGLTYDWCPIFSIVVKPPLSCLHAPMAEPFMNCLMWSIINYPQCHQNRWYTPSKNGRFITIGFTDLLYYLLLSLQNHVFGL